jgi:hypothetical protein
MGSPEDDASVPGRSITQRLDALVILLEAAGVRTLLRPRTGVLRERFQPSLTPYRFSLPALEL